MLNNIKIQKYQHIQVTDFIVNKICNKGVKKLIVNKICKNFKLPFSFKKILMFKMSQQKILFNKNSLLLNIGMVPINPTYIINLLASSNNPYVTFIDKNEVSTVLKFGIDQAENNIDDPIFNLSKRMQIQMLLTQYNSLAIYEYKYLYFHADIDIIKELITFLNDHLSIIDCKNMQNLFDENVVGYRAAIYYFIIYQNILFLMLILFIAIAIIFIKMRFVI